VKSDRETIIRIVRKVNKHGGHHGGAWKVAFADFMTAMMALFLVLWLVTQSSDVRSAIAGYFQDPLGRGDQFGTSMIPGDGQPMIPSTNPIQVRPGDGRRQELLALSASIQKAITDSLMTGAMKENLVIEMTEDGMRISLLEDSTGVFFATGSPTPRGLAEPVFRALGGLLGKADFPIVIEGHTDAMPYGDGRGYSNWELSADRANAVRRLMVAGGLSDPQILAVRGLADRSLRIPTNPLASQNRRVTIEVKMNATAADSTGTP
jgi:chemotaxis protein MotB